MKIARPLVSNDGCVADILVNMVFAIAKKRSLKAPYSVVLVDHGSPTENVNRTRRAVAAQMRIRLAGNASCVVDCSMESRPGKQYAFNQPLLENVFDQGGLDQGDVILAMLFLSPGRHAGENGDIANIINTVLSTKQNLTIHQTGLIGDVDINGDAVLSILQQRCHSAFLLN